MINFVYSIKEDKNMIKVKYFTTCSKNNLITFQYSYKLTKRDT